MLFGFADRGAVRSPSIPNSGPGNGPLGLTIKDVTDGTSKTWCIGERRAALLLVIGAASLVAGCWGRGFAEVSGTVTSAGKPVSGAFIVFAPERKDEVRGVGATDKDGHYRILRPGGKFGAPLGRNTVSIHGGDAGRTVPASFGTKSNLTFEVKPGRNVFDIEIPPP
jgi:hypothetical protein